MNYRVKSGKHYRREGDDLVCYRAGDAFEATEEELAGNPDRFELVVEPEAKQTAPEAEAESPAEAPVEQEAEAEGMPAAETSGIGTLLESSIVETLEASGVTTLEQLSTLASDPESLEAIPGIGKAKARKIRQALMNIEIPQSEDGNG